MKALLISLQKDLDTIGLKYLHYYLRNNGHESSVLYIPDFKPNNKRQLENIKRFIVEINPQFIGISLMSHEYHNACHLTKYLKSFIESIPIVWGGIHPTASPETCLDYADYVCVGEGERTILDIANAIDEKRTIKNTNNLCYRETDLIRQNPLYPLIDNLDMLPFYEHMPANGFILTASAIIKLNKKIFKRYAKFLGRTYSIMATRGCPFSCAYCCNNFIPRLYPHNRIRRRSIRNIMEELEMALKDNPEIECINFQDDCFLGFNDDYLKEFCEIYKDTIGKPFVIRAIPIYTAPGKIRSLKDAGLAWITIGLQSGSDRINKEIYKRNSLKKDFLKAADIVKDFGIAACYDVILDNPFENEEDKFETLDTLIKTPKPFFAEFYSLTFYHKTELYEKVKSEHPECLEDCLEKDYLILQKNSINNLIKLAAFLTEKRIRILIDLYRTQPKSVRFKIYLFIANLLTFLALQPITYFQVLRLSQGGSYLKAFKVLPMYFKAGMLQYTSQIKTALRPALKPSLN